MTNAPASVPELDKLLERIRYVPKRVAHHADHSGYDVLFATCGMKKARSGAFVRFAGWIPGGLAWRLWSLRAQPSQRSGLEAEIAAIPWIATGQGRLCHFIYGEDTYLFTPLWKRSANRAVATLHYPPEVLSQRVNPGSLKSLDAIIIVGENQREWLSKVVSPEKIHFCPHHVDTDFFCPADNPEPRPSQPAAFRLICVGHLYRDYDSLIQILRLLRIRHGLQVHLDIVGLQKRSDHAITFEPDVSVHRGISDEALRDLYRNASMGVLPLTDSTANNALLEMMACGLPVVTTDIGGVRDYAKNSGVIMQTVGDIDSFAQTVNNLLNDPKASQQQAIANRLHAVQELSIEVCAKRLAAIYASLLS